MLDIFTKILGSVMSQMNPGGDKLGKIEKDLARKFDALENQARQDSRRRWMVLGLVCVLLGAAAAVAFRVMGRETKAMVTERMDQEFASARLQQTIEESAKKYAELHLKSYVDTQLAAHVRVAKLEMLAREDSRKAFEELAALAADPQFKEDAEFSLSIVRKRYASLVYPFEVQSAAETVEGSALQMKLDPNRYSAALMDSIRPRLADLAKESEKNYLVPDFLRFLKESDSLAASVGVCRILAHNYGDKAGDFEFQKWIQILETLDRNAVKISGK